MKWEELIQQLAEALKMPETVEEAMDFVQKDPSCQAVIEDMAYKQVVLNILVAAGIVSEKDFNDSVKHFKDALTRGFAEKIMQNINGTDDGLNGVWINVDQDDQDKSENNEDDWEWPDDDTPIGKA